MTIPVTSIFQQFKDLDGEPLDNGYVWIGIANQNPQTAPISVYWDFALTQPAAQPLRTLNGYFHRSGTPANIFVASDYSETVRDVRLQLVTTTQSAAASGDYGAILQGPNGSDSVGYIGGGTGSVAETVQDKLRQYVAPEDKGAVGDRSTDDTVAVQNAIYTAASTHAVFWLLSNYRITGPLDLPSNTVIDGPGSLYLDYTALAGSPAISAAGVISSNVPLSANVATSDTKAVVGTTASFANATHCGISDQRYSVSGNAYPTIIMPISSLSAGTNINFTFQCNVAYTTGNSAFAFPIEAVMNIHVRRLHVTFSPTADISQVLGFAGVAGLKIGKEVYVDDHRCGDGPSVSSSCGIIISNCDDVCIEGSTLTSLNASGCGLLVEQTSNLRFGAVEVTGYAFGIEIVNSFSPVFSPCIIRGAGGTIAIRGFKLAGVKGARGDIGVITGFDSGMKINDSDRYDIAGAMWDCGLNDNHVVGIGSLSSSDQGACSSGRLVVRINGQPSTGAYAIFLDTFCPNTYIEAKIFGVNGGGILCQSVECVLRGEIVEWDSLGSHTSGKSAVIFPQLCDVSVKCFAADSAKFAYSTTGGFNVVNAGLFSGNISINNPFDPTKLTDLYTCIVGVNNVLGVPRTFLGTAAPVAGAWIPNDKVIRVPAVSGSYEGWVNTAAGSPGTFDEFGTIA